MREDTLPLFELFTRLRQADFPLGIDEYKLLLRALEAGFGGPTLEAGFGGPALDSLACLCRTLWVKSETDRKVFDYHFQQIMNSFVSRDTASSFIPSLGSSFSQKEPFPSHIPANETLIFQAAPPTNREINAEVEAVQAVLHTASEDELPYSRFVRSDEYFPVTRRQMKQSWRYLRRLIREGPATDIDIEKTVENIGQQGMLLEPVFFARRVNRIELLLLIDQGGSMVPFHALTSRFVETALRGGNQSNARIFYFRNVPGEYLFLDSAHYKAKPTREVMDGLQVSQTVVLILSDAGAARGYYSEVRESMTKGFLTQLRQHTRSRAWLNPVPSMRWSGTTAEQIAQMVPMFNIGRKGLDTAISVLCGRFLPQRK